jgi:hypothetical protein
VMFTFSLSSWIDDLYVGVRGNFAIRNASWAPYLPGTEDRPDELVMPLPKGFTGAIVRDEFQEVVGIDPSRGFVIRRPIPPGGYQFVAGFSLKTDDGNVHWSMPLPLGAFDSGIEFRRFGAMTLELPTTVRGIKIEDANDQRGQFFVMSPITILPNQSMTFDLHGLPKEPAWRTQPKIIAGVIVLALLAVGLLFALWRPAPSTLPNARFDALLDELTVLESKDGDPARRAALMAELESLYQPPHHQSPQK